MITNLKNDRTKLILNLIIEEYIASGTPVSSKFISQEPSVSASPATIRNDMCQLERLGYICSPHTSAGRIPTKLGLQYFVEQILTRKQQQTNMLQKLSASLGSSSDPEVVCEKAAKLIADMTQLTGLVVMPKSNDVVIRQLELVRLADKRLLCVLIDEHDKVQNRVVELSEDVTDDIIQQTLLLLNTALSGFSMAEGAERLPYFIKQSDPKVYDLVKLALFGDTVTTNEQQVFCSGEIRLLNPEISSDTETLKRIITSFTDISPLMPCFHQCDLDGELKAFIGNDIGVSLFENCALIVKPFLRDGRPAGYIAVVGPQRLDYSAVLPAVDISANILTTALNR